MHFYKEIMLANFIHSSVHPHSKSPGVRAFTQSTFIMDKDTFDGVETSDVHDGSSPTSLHDSAGSLISEPKRKKQLLKRGAKANAVQLGPARRHLNDTDPSRTDMCSQLDPASHASLTSNKSYVGEEDEEERAQQCSRESLIELYSHLSQPRFALRCREPPMNMLLPTPGH